MSQRQEFTPEDVKSAIENNTMTDLRRVFKSLDPADIAELMRALDPAECLIALKLVQAARRTMVFVCLPSDVQEVLIEIMPDDRARAIVNEMEPDDRTHLLEDVNERLRIRLLSLLEPEELRVANILLGYPEDSIGRIMSPRFLAIPAGMTVNQAIHFVRWNASRYSEEAVGFIFIVDNEGKYLGDTTLAALFVAEDASLTVESLAKSSYVALSVYDDETNAVTQFRKYQKPAMPVVDAQGRLCGMVTVDDVFAVAENFASEDIQQFGGAGVLEDSYFHTSLWQLWRSRAGWLLLLFLGGLCSGRALRQYQSEISRFAFLVFFLPLIVSSGGNSGSQAASLVIRGLAIRELEINDWRRVLSREIVAGSGLGAVLAVLGMISAVAWGLNPSEALVVGTALIGVVIFGALLGAMLPFVLKKFNVDPAVSSSPLIASLADLFGILILFNVALWLL